MSRTNNNLFIYFFFFVFRRKTNNVIIFFRSILFQLFFGTQKRTPTILYHYYRYLQLYTIMYIYFHPLSFQNSRGRFPLTNRIGFFFLFFTRLFDYRDTTLYNRYSHLNIPLNTYICIYLNNAGEIFSSK